MMKFRTKMHVQKKHNTKYIPPTFVDVEFHRSLNDEKRLELIEKNAVFSLNSLREDVATSGGKIEGKMKLRRPTKK